MPSPPPDPQNPPDQGLTEPEPFGPLLLRRLVKADGRALLLFSRPDAPPPDAGEQA